ncbi:hypothetical protein F4861DRAFT_518656, partial [Xylaria intraflava]
MDPVSLSSEYAGWKVYVFLAVFTPLVILFVGLRFYARYLSAARYGLEDWLILVALAAQLVETGIFIASLIQSGVGYHVTYLEATSPEKVPLFLKYLVAESVWYLATIWIAKASICMLYRRLFPGRVVYVLLWTIIAIVIATSIATVIALLAACTPFSANWGSPEVQATQCINKEPIFVWGTLPNVITDAVMLVLPLPIVWNLQMAVNLKIALTGTFVIGSLGLVTSILRLLSFNNSNSFTDATYNAVVLQIVTLAEAGIYIISACLLVMRPLLEKVRDRATTILSKNRTTGLGGSVGNYELSRTPYNRQRGESQNSIRKEGPDHLWTDEEQGQIGMPGDRSQFVAAASYGPKVLTDTQNLLPSPTNGHGGQGNPGIVRTTVIKQSWGEA